ncbi:FecR family protein [Pedobacter psychroterrae]|uniref:DUF4974 domain-containing protein n=1 Tax=Pedobacter psychroterrae TaxID=2530453 RepID=A0A4V2MLL6_9SPHI|nr:FecR domain-containing protein [Pedobacter psychroterrae]TCD02547.1 DUF4974 domain-containing protein [Pedobacter psychroterrae]
MEKKHFISILSKYLQGDASLEERNFLYGYYALFMADEDVMLLISDELKEKLKANVKAGIDERIGEEINVRIAEVTTPTRLWPRLVGVAAAVAAITLGVWFYYTPRHPDTETSSAQAAVNDIAPGKNTATLTLANGKVLHLDTNRTSVTVTDSVQVTTMLTASTPRGGTYQVVLPDGTQVWLNADSKISFPSQFTGSERKILLEGEAYFEVAKNKKMPFIVESGGQLVEVLGTHFNIKAYQDEGSIKTTLLEGSVKVSRQPTPGGKIGKGFSEVLKPNQQAIMTGNKLDVIIANIEQTIAWKNGMIVFQKQSLQDIMRGVSRWYDVEVVYGPGLENILLTGSISRFKDISSILQVLELTGKVHFKVEGRRVTVMK